MSDDDKSYRYVQISLTLLIAAKIFGYLTVLGFIAGVFHGQFFVSILMALLFAIPAAICFIVSLILDKKVTQLDEAILAAEMQKKQLKYDENKDTAMEAYDKVCDVLQKPAITNPIEIYEFASDVELKILQSEGKAWKYYIRSCECWVLTDSEEYTEGALYFFESPEAFNGKVRANPEDFSDLEASVAHVWREIIPLHNILELSISGDVETTSTVSGGDAKYLGVSVNGIGFGEWKVDPVQVHHNVHDKRVLELRFIDEDANEVRSIYFPLEAAEVLEQVIGSIS